MPALPLLALWSALAGPAHATMVEVDEVACPVGEDRVKVYKKLAGNTYGGFDSDLADYSTKGQFREFAISTCANNLYSVYGPDMVAELAPPVLARLMRALGQERGKLKTPDDPQVWERYGIAARMYRELGKDHRFLGQLYVEASWTARDAAVGVFKGIEGPESAKTWLDQGERELTTQTDPARRKMLLYNLARIAQRAGQNNARDRYLKEFAAMGPMTAAETEAVERFHYISQEVEPRYQDLAIQEFRSSLASDTLTPELRSNVMYLLAELLRRRGQPEEAQEWFGKVLADPATPENLRGMASFLSAQIAG